MAELRGKKMTQEEKVATLKREAIVHAEGLYDYRLIARATGITEDTLKKYRDTDPEFSEQLEKARVQFIAKRVKRAKDEFILERLEPEIFKERKEVDERSEQNINVNVVNYGDSKEKES